jgi:acetyl-CoA carboxylase biotin carboxylase subunit
MFRKILIANRGEIALRILWACKDLGVRTVAVHSQADTDSLHVKFADEDVCVGPPRSKDSYLNISSIIAAAEITDADAIHPGYGFLAESAHFAEVSEACGITFIGPSPEIIRQMGDKVRARQTVAAAGVPVLPGSDGPVPGPEEALHLAADIGYPVILKAVAGGGGRGMRIVRDEEEMVRSFEVARLEAKGAFDVADVYLEKYLERPRHIEFQLLGDKHGSLIQLGERDCSIQRRHQKLVEESPSPALSPELRAQMAEAALRAGRAVNYHSAGTIEFLLDEDSGRFYFIEMNTRIQVEHPVTEMVTRLDLVKEQILVAAGERLSVRQDEVRFHGAAIECRINAEDPETFAPSPGLITSFHLPGGPGIRVDTAAYPEYRVPPFYDSLLAKMITHGNSRREALTRMKRCLEVTVIEGIRTNLALHQRILSDPEFQAGRFNTRFLEKYFVPADLARKAD